MKRLFQSIFGAAALAAVAAPSIVSAATVTFDQSSDLSKFAVTTNSGTPALSIVNNGVNSIPTIGASAAQVTGGDATATYNQKFTLAAGNTASMSVYVANTGITNGGQILIEGGFGDHSSDVFNNGAGFRSIFSRFVSITNTANSTNQYNFKSDNKFQDAGASETPAVLPQVTIASGSGSSTPYYLYTFTLTREAGANSNNFDATTSLYAVDSFFVPSSTALYSYTTTYLNAALATAATTGMYAGFRVGAGSGEARIDNFTAVPEPQSTGVLATVAMSGWALARRRRGGLIAG